MKAPSSYVALLTTTLSECWMMHANSQSDMEFGSLRTHTLGCVLIHNCSQIRCSSGVKTVTEVVATYTATHINVGCKQACCMLIPAPAYLTGSTVNAGDSQHTKSGRCRHQQQGRCTSGLFKCVLWRNFGIALPDRGKAGRAGADAEQNTLAGGFSKQVGYEPLEALQGCIRQAALERQNSLCSYLAHHEPESVWELILVSVRWGM